MSDTPNEMGADLWAKQAPARPDKDTGLPHGPQGEPAVAAKKAAKAAKKAAKAAKKRG